MSGQDSYLDQAKKMAGDAANYASETAKAAQETVMGKVRPSGWLLPQYYIVSQPPLIPHIRYCVPPSPMPSRSRDESLSADACQRLLSSCC